MVGRTLTHYRIVERLGAGGMGEVYRARDEKLGRDVALKVLPEGALSGEEARRRLRREAHFLSRLSHPHLATLLDFDSEDGVDFLVMELVGGRSLEPGPGPIPQKDILRLGAQLAMGLQAAHEQGVVHRDIKPSNLRLTPDGLLKILDFGVARLLPAGSLPEGESTTTETAPGVVVGSPPYMAPEQLLAKPTDARTDLYAAGAVLYELATGRRPFGNRRAAELTDAILHEPPAPPRSLNPALSPGLEAIIVKALDKDPDLRYQTARELLVDLERLRLPLASPPSGRGAADWLGALAPRRRTVVISATVITALAATWLLRPEAPPRITDIRPLRLDVGPAFRGDFTFRGAFTPTWTTDGVRLYYVAQKERQFALYSVALDGGEPVEVPTPFGYGFEVYGYLRRFSGLVAVPWLPDLTAAPPPVWLLPVPAGTPRRLGNLVASAVAVSPDERKLALTVVESPQPRILVVGLDDLAAPPLTELRLPRGGGFAPHWSPDGGRLRFDAPGPPGHEAETWVWETAGAGEGLRPLWPGRARGWTADGQYFLLERSPILLAAEMPVGRSDILAVSERRRLPWTRSRPFSLTRGPVSFTEVGPRPDGRGLLAFGTIPRGELQRFDRGTRRFERFLGGESVGMVQTSPDGEWLAWVTFPETTLWRGRRDGSERLQLTRPPGQAYMPSWSPDGKRIAFIGLDPADGSGSVQVVSADGGPIETLQRAPTGSVYWDPCWLPDGRSLLFSGLTYRSGMGIHRLDLTTREVEPYEGAENLFYPKCGPQGQLLAVRPPDVGGVLGPTTLMVHWPEREGWEEIGPATVAYPTWTRDGGSFCGLAPFLNRIDCYSFAPYRLETITEVGENRLLNWIAVPWFGLDTGDNPLVMFDRSTRDLYALDWEAP